MNDLNSIQRHVCHSKLSHLVGSPQWVDCLCEYLQCVSTTNDMKRLIINAPPRLGKSTFVNVLWPCWQWARDGGRSKWLFATRLDELAIRDSQRRRALMSSQWYQDLFGDLFHFAEDQNQKHNYLTDKGGTMYSGHIGGMIGRGADYILVDDPHKVEDCD